MRNLTVRLYHILKKEGISPMLGIHIGAEEFHRFKNSGKISYRFLCGERGAEIYDKY